MRMLCIITMLFFMIASGNKNLKTYEMTFTKISTKEHYILVTVYPISPLYKRYLLKMMETRRKSNKGWLAVATMMSIGSLSSPENPGERRPLAEALFKRCQEDDYWEYLITKLENNEIDGFDKYEFFQFPLYSDYLNYRNSKVRIMSGESADQYLATTHLLENMLTSSFVN